MDLTQLLAVAIGSFRIGAFLVASPLWSSAAVPGTVKALLALALSAALAPVQMSTLSPYLHDQGSMLLVVFREIGLGFAMGFTIRLLLMIVLFAMELASMQMGLGIASIFDPIHNQQQAVLAEIALILSMLFLLNTNFHHEVFIVLFKSYQLLPLGLPDWQWGSMLTHMLDYLKHAFIAGFNLALPITIAMLVMHVVTGVITRTAPQLNLFFNVSLTLNVVVAFLILWASLPYFYPQIERFWKHLISTNLGLA